MHGTVCYVKVDCFVASDPINLVICKLCVLQSFLGAMFDTLLYQLNDALSRLVNVRKYEFAKDGQLSWI